MLVTPGQRYSAESSELHALMKCVRIVDGLSGVEIFTLQIYCCARTFISIIITICIYIYHLLRNHRHHQERLDAYSRV